MDLSVRGRSFRGRGTFNEMVGALKSGNLDGFYGAMHPAFTMIDEDSPFRMSKASFRTTSDSMSVAFGRVLNGSR